MSNYLIEMNEAQMELSFKGVLSIDELRAIIDIADRKFDSVTIETAADVTNLVFYNEKDDE